MALNNIQERIERSLFELIRKELVEQGFVPDITDSVRYPTAGGVLTQIAQNNWNTDLDTIQSTKGYAIEIFGASSSDAKGLKRIPRVVIVPHRIMPGEVGLGPGNTYNRLDPDTYVKTTNPLEAANMHFDIHLLSEKIRQSRILNAILQKCLGQKRYVTFYDNIQERFFIKNYNFYDLPDARDGIEENVYSYEVQDLFIFDDSTEVNVASIKEINTEFIIGYKTELESTDPPVLETLTVT